MSPEEGGEREARREKIDRFVDERLRRAEDELLALAEERERAEVASRDRDPRRRLRRFFSR
jgi:rRNA-processing protein FCF1